MGVGLVSSKTILMLIMAVVIVVVISLAIPPIYNSVFDGSSKLEFSKCDDEFLGPNLKTCEIQYCGEGSENDCSEEEQELWERQLTYANKCEDNKEDCGKFQLKVLKADETQESPEDEPKFTYHISYKNAEFIFNDDTVLSPGDVTLRFAQTTGWQVDADLLHLSSFRDQFEPIKGQKYEDGLKAIQDLILNGKGKFEEVIIKASDATLVNYYYKGDKIEKEHIFFNGEDAEFILRDSGSGTYVIEDTEEYKEIGFVGNTYFELFMDQVKTRNFENYDILNKNFNFMTGGFEFIEVTQVEPGAGAIGSTKVTYSVDATCLQKSFGLSDEFYAKIEQVAQSLNTKPEYLIAVMNFETGGTFNPAEKNKAGSSGTGLIQFMAATAKGLGTSTSKLAAMSQVQQMDYVEKYLKPYMKYNFDSIPDVYLSVLCPSVLKRNTPYFASSDGSHYCSYKNKGSGIEYKQNKGLDVNGDGLITTKEISSKVINGFEKKAGSCATRTESIDMGQTTDIEDVEVYRVEVSSCLYRNDGGGTEWHGGSDFVFKYNSASGHRSMGIPAVAGGEVVKSSAPTGGGYGNYVMIKTKDNYYDFYAHLKTRYVQVGDKVSAGDLIGEQGNTGCEPCPVHLHFGHFTTSNHAKAHHDNKLKPTEYFLERLKLLGINDLSFQQSTCYEAHKQSTNPDTILARVNAISSGTQVS